MENKTNETIAVTLDFIMDHIAYKRTYDGINDDLLSAGLGNFGLHKDAFGNNDISGNPIGI